MKNNFIDLFAGCGGLSLGLLKAGWNGVLAVERDEMAFATLERNLIENQNYSFEWPAWLPKRPLDISSFVGNFKKELRQMRGSIKLIAGGPPCQGFSFAGRRKSGDRRNNLAERYYLEVVRLVRPEYVLIENVSGISVGFSGRDGGRRVSHADRIADKLRKMRYAVFAQTMLAVDYGVAQRRPRYIMIAVRALSGQRLEDVVNPFILEPETRNEFLTAKNIKAPVSVGRAISDLEVGWAGTRPSIDTPKYDEIHYRRPRNGYQRMLHEGVNGGGPNSLRLAKHRPNTEKRFEYLLRGRRGVTLSRAERQGIWTNKHVIVVLDANQPSHTLTTLPDDMLHYKEPRILTVRECARLQSFPDWFEFLGKYTTGGHRRTREAPRYTQVGNAVPPLLAEGIGNLLLKYNSWATLEINSGER